MRQRISIEKQIDTFARLTVPEPNTGCLLWTGARNKKGYGKVNVGDRMAIASRVAWVLEIGPIPNGMEVCHKCDTPPCVNAAHLFLATTEQNQADKVAKQRQARGDKNGQARLTRHQAEAILFLSWATNFSELQIARQFGIARTIVGRIKRGQLWRVLKRPPLPWMIRVTPNSSNRPDAQLGNISEDT